MKVEFFLLSVALLLPHGAQANENFKCKGVREALGLNADMADSPDKGKLHVNSAIKGALGLSFSDKDSSQEISFKNSVMKGMLVEGLTTFQYDNDQQLVAVSAQTNKAGDKDVVLYGQYYTYDWKTGGCRTTRQSIRNFDLLQEAEGVVFDQELCIFLKKQKGLEPERNEACSGWLATLNKKLREYDARLRAQKKKQMLVTLGEVGYSIHPLRTEDNGQSLSFFSKCTEFFQMEKKNPPRGQPQQDGHTGESPAP